MRDEPLPIKQTDLENFKAAYKRRFGVELDTDTARRELTRICRLLEVVFRPALKEGGAYEN